MCGIAGLWDLSASGAAESLNGRALAMAERLSHRGPDGLDAWLDGEAGLAFGHSRLAIIDPSEAGAQPMVSACGRYAITYNGEIYNAAALRAELEARGQRFRGHSDTEALIEAIAAYGIEKTLEKAVGMFAFALWDGAERRLHLVRDRMGQKPLYYGRIAGAFAFASEPRAFFALADFTGKSDREALAAYLHWGFVPAPLSIYRGIAQLRPGEWLCLDAGGGEKTARYWDLGKIAAAGLARPDHRPLAEVAEELGTLLDDAVASQMIADVPLGLFLSGGIDSSLVAAAMKRAEGRVDAFSLGFTETAHDERGEARAVAEALDLNWHPILLTAERARAHIARLDAIQDEPLADMAQLPAYLLAAEARGQVTVALGGDGGDELFAGYSRHLWARRLGRPSPLLRLGGRALGALPASVLDAAERATPGDGRARHWADKADKLARALHAGGAENAYEALLEKWPSGESRLPDEGKPPVDPLHRFRYLDARHYLPDNVLTKVDRASMAVGLEVRAPFLDHRIVEFAWRLGPNHLIDGGKGKVLLRRLLARDLPQTLVDRPKSGFTVPLGAWLGGPLREWTEDLLESVPEAAEGLIDETLLKQAWQDHLKGRRDRGQALWTVLRLAAWKRHWRR